MRRRLLLPLIGALALVASPVATSTASAATSPIDARYASDATARAALGAPSSGEYSIASGRERDYAHGAMLWSSASGVHYVLSDLLPKYRALGGPAAVGFPIHDQAELWSSNHAPSDHLVDLQKGTIEYVFGFGQDVPHYLPAPIETAYWNGDGYYGYGAVTSDPIATAHSGLEVRFRSGRIYWSATTGAHGVQGYVLDKYLLKGGPSGFLGLPKEDWKSTSTGDGLLQAFQGGSIYQRYGASAAYEVHGGIRSRFNAEGGVAALGYPVTDELAASYGRVQRFERGEIRYRSADGTTSVIYY